MRQARRDFLRVLTAAGSLAMSGAILNAQGRHKFPDPPQPAEQGDVGAAPINTQSAQRAQLKLNEKEFRESLASLYDRVIALKQDVDGTRTSNVFSVKVYKETGEIEHLAKKLRSLAKI